MFNTDQKSFLLKFIPLMTLASIYPFFAAPFTRDEYYADWFFANLHFSLFPFIFSFGVSLFLSTFSMSESLRQNRWRVTAPLLLGLLLLGSLIGAIDAAGLSAMSVFTGNLLNAYSLAIDNLFNQSWDFRFRKLWNTTAIVITVICLWHLICVVFIKYKASRSDVRRISLAVALLGLWFPVRLYSLWILYQQTGVFKNYTALTVALWVFALAMILVGILNNRLNKNDRNIYLVCVATPFVLGQLFSLDKFMNFIPESFAAAHVGGKLIVLAIFILILFITANELGVIDSLRGKNANKAN